MSRWRQRKAIARRYAPTMVTTIDERHAGTVVVDQGSVARCTSAPLTW